MMEQDTPEIFLHLKSRNSRLLGLDIGTKYIGLSLSDNIWMVASPLKTIQRTRLSRDREIIATLVKEHNIVGLVAGLPVNMNGTEGPRVQATRDYMKELGQFLDIPVAFQDERLTTVMAANVLLEADVSRRKRAASIDKMAAGIILQGFLDRLANMERIAREVEG